MPKKLTKREKKAARAVEQPQAPKKLPTDKPAGLLTMMTLFILLVLILPLVISRKTIDPVLSPRYLWLSIFVLAFPVVFFILKRKHQPLNTPRLVQFLLGAGLAVGIWSIITITAAINKSEALYQVCRYFLFLGLLVIVINTVQNESSRVLGLCKAFVITAGIQGLVGILQYYEVGFNDLPGANAKPYGLMANRNLFGSAQMLMLPFLMYCLYKGNRFWKYLSALAVMITVISLLLSQTRSAWIGGFLVVAFSLIGVLVYVKEESKKWIVATSIAVAAIVLVSFLVVKTDTRTLSQSVQERAASITLAADNSEASANANERVKIWKATIAMFKQHPLLGVGPGNWRVAVPPYGDENNVWAYGNYIPDRPHNLYLHILSESGIPGALLYFSIWVIIGIIAFKALAKTKSPNQRVLLILMLSGLIAFASDCFFSFPAERIEHSLYMTLMAGIIVGIYCSQQTGPAARKWNLSGKASIAFILIALINIFFAWQKQSFEIHMNRVKAYDKLNRAREVLTEVEAGKSPYATIDPDNKPLEMYSGLAYKTLRDYPRAVEEMNKALRYNPNSAMIYNNLGTIYTDMKLYDSAHNNYMRGLDIAPKFDIIYKNLASNAFAAGNYARCLDALSKVNIEGEAYLINMRNEAKRLLGVN